MAGTMRTNSGHSRSDFTPGSCLLRKRASAFSSPLREMVCRQLQSISLEKRHTTSMHACIHTDLPPYIPYHPYHYNTIPCYPYHPYPPYHTLHTLLYIHYIHYLHTIHSTTYITDVTDIRHITCHAMPYCCLALQYNVCIALIHIYV